MNHAVPTHQRLAADLRQAREEASLTQLQLADLAQLSSRPIYIFETGKGSIRLDTYLKLLDVLGLELSVVPRGPNS